LQVIAGDRFKLESCAYVDAIKRGMDLLEVGLQQETIEQNHRLLQGLDTVLSSLSTIETGLERIDSGVQEVVKRASRQSEKAARRKREAAEMTHSMQVMHIDLKSRELCWDPNIVLGKGASASVHPCTLDGADLAVKVFHLKGESVAVRAKTYRQLEKEVSTINKVQHENVLKVHGVAETDDHLLLVMDRWECSAKDYVKAKRVLKSTVMFILAQAARGLQAIHEQKLLHRDIKGQNILVRVVAGRLQACVCDFGITKLERLNETTAQTGFKGTAAFMAPEQLQDLRLTLKADIYAFGIMIWELAAGGVSPWEGQQQFAVMNKVVNEQKRPPIELVDQHGYPDTLIELMEACWHHLPAKRPKVTDLYEQMWGMYCVQLQQEHLHSSGAQGLAKPRSVERSSSGTELVYDGLVAAHSAVEPGRWS
jgi:tRNA A-37 threonylcarbamoyl transferase component Bud32